jgi:hypothetical protein
MIGQSPKPKAIFPDMPRDTPFVGENGMIAPQWKNFFDQWSLAMQTFFKNEGLVIPQLSASDIASLGNTNASVGNILYDNTNNLFKGILLVTPGTLTTPPVTITKTFTLT